MRKLKRSFVECPVCKNTYKISTNKDYFMCRKCKQIILLSEIDK